MTCSTYVALLPALLRWLKTVYQQTNASIVRNLAVAVARVPPSPTSSSYPIQPCWQRCNDRASAVRVGA